MAPSAKHYDYLVIGGGSAGVASARRAAKYGAKALVVEANRLGGTCVNVGCVPKKIMWAAASMASKIRDAKEYGFTKVDPKMALEFDWHGFKQKRDAYIERLNGIYSRNMEKEGVDFVFGWAKFSEHNHNEQGHHLIEVTLRDGTVYEYSAEHVSIAAGGAPSIPKGIPGAELGITSDGFFELEEQAKKVAIVGAGYIGVEFAGVFNGLGTETHLFIRGDTVLRAFDSIIQNMITDTSIKHGVNIHKRMDEKKTLVEKLSNGKLKFTYSTESEGPKSIEVDQVIWTIGRRPLSESLNLHVKGISVDKKGRVIADKFQNTNVSKIYSLGDISDTDFELTPVAIAAGRKLSNRLFGPAKYKDQFQEMENIPSVVFSHPVAGTIGLSEQRAIEKYGKDKIKVYQSKFIPMYYAMFSEQEDKEFICYKLIVTNDDQEKVLGLHLVGDESSEILQGFGAAIRMGATKADFDNVVAIHPTSAEEIVTMT